MKVTLLQQDIAWGAAAANRRRAEEAIRAAAGSDLYVLPEMFATGFATEPAGMAEGEGESLSWMQKMADETGAAIAGSVATEEGGRYYNRFYFVKPATEEPGVHYDKRHLFTYGGENRRYTAGEGRVVVEWRGVRFLLQVCYDLRFPIFARNEAEGAGSYDAIIYVASWPASRRAVWDILLKARAIENQCYVLGVNRVGSDPTCGYNGGTVAVDAYGRVVAACPDDEVGAVTVEVEKEKLEAFRRKFPVLRDRDFF